MHSITSFSYEKFGKAKVIMVVIQEVKLETLNPNFSAPIRAN